MTRYSLNKHLNPIHAPSLLGAFFFFVLSLGLASCQEEHPETRTWKDLGTPERHTLGQAAPKPQEVESIPEATGNELRFLAYNLKNYLSMSRYVDRERKVAFKPEEEITAVVALITAANPDVLGICEIGTAEDLKGLQEKLRQAGLDLPHSEHTGGSDQTRHLALLSRFPITNTDSQSELFYTLEGERTQIRRGILDATITAKGQSFRFLGAHLKSKREIRGSDQELIRRNEAHLLRKHADAILAEAPDTHLVVYGDLNDTRRSTAVRAISGPGNSRGFLEPLFLKDSRGEVWTHFWQYQHVYSRFDYIMVSRGLRPLVSQDQTLIFEHPDSATASDHRATQAVFTW